MMIFRIVLAILMVVILGLCISMINCLQSGTVHREASWRGPEGGMALDALSAGAYAGERGKGRGRAGVVAETEKGKYYQYTGALHIHTAFSDGGGSYREVGAVADSLGLDYIIPCDHNFVKTFRANPTPRVGNTLIIPGVEISPGKGFGHFVVLGDSIPPVPRGLASPDSALLAAYNQGNMIFIAHPYTRGKNSWTHWEKDTYTGFELFNLDENWRQTFSLSRLNRFIGGLFVYFFRDDALNYIISYPGKEMEQFDRKNRIRKVVGIGSTDAHARIKVWKGFDIHFPSYPSMLKQIQTVVVTRERFDGGYEHDRKLVLNSLRRGSSFVVLSGLEDGRGFIFSAVSDTTEVSLGDSLRLGEWANLRVVVPDSVNTVIQVLRDGSPVGEYRGRSRVDLRVDDPGSYRVQVFQERVWLPFFRKHSFPWIFSNPIYLYR